MFNIGLRLLIGLLILIALGGCVSGTTMSKVMNQCDDSRQFDIYASCIRNTYDKQGRYPNDAVVRAFYANLNEITEGYKSGKLSDAQAKSAAYNAYLKTVDASNKSIARPAYCISMGGGDMLCN